MHTERTRSGRIRIISARRATRHEKKSYEELDKKLVASLGGPERIAAILRALAMAVGDEKPKRDHAA